MKAEYVTAVLTGQVTLPELAQRYEWFDTWEKMLKAKEHYADKYHYLGDGSDQWDYCRFLARESGLIFYSSSSSSAHGGGGCYRANMDAYITMLSEIYEDNIAHRPVCPGASDVYRERKYTVNL